MNEYRFLRMCAGPGEVRQLQVSSTNTSLNLRWIPPCPRLAPISFYRIQLELRERTNCNLFGGNCANEWNTKVGFKCISSLLLLFIAGS